MKNAAPSNYEGWAKVQQIAILWDAANPQHSKEVALLEEALKNEGKKVRSIYFIPTKKPKENADEKGYYKNDVGVLGKPKKKLLNSYLQPTDVLINWTIGQPSPNEFIAALLPANFRVCVNQQNAFYDVCVAAASKPEETILEIIKYLKIINNA